MSMTDVRFMRSDSCGQKTVCCISGIQLFMSGILIFVSEICILHVRNMYSSCQKFYFSCQKTRPISSKYISDMHVTHGRKTHQKLIPLEEEKLGEDFMLHFVFNTVFGIVLKREI